MKTKSIDSLLKSLDSGELKELRKQFNSEVTRKLYTIREAEAQELKDFVDKLDLTGYRADANLNAVSINHYNATREDREALHRISDAISDAFNELKHIKRRIASEARRHDIPNSRFFTTTLKRMKKAKVTFLHDRNVW